MLKFLLFHSDSSDMCRDGGQNRSGGRACNFEKPRRYFELAA